jgi:hypothetical protein
MRNRLRWKRRPPTTPSTRQHHVGVPPSALTYRELGHGRRLEGELDQNVCRPYRSVSEMAGWRVPGPRTEVTLCGMIVHPPRVRSVRWECDARKWVATLER